MTQAVQIRHYLDDRGKNLYMDWFDRLDPVTAVRVNQRVARLALGNPGDVKPVGEGVSELRIHVGSGYRVYFGQDGRTLVILLGGGTKSTQDRDIAAAKRAWARYKMRKGNP